MVQTISKQQFHDAFSFEGKKHHFSVEALANKPKRRNGMINYCKKMRGL